MKLGRLVTREILHRKVNFILAVVGVALAVTCVLATLAAMRSYDLDSDKIIAAMESDTQAEMRKLEDDIRKTMKGLGFNIYIFPKDQDMGEVYDQGFASKTMPEEYATTLANSKIVTVNHLLPSLTQKLEWPEKKRTVILIGVRGEVPLAHRDPKSPLIDPVDKGELVLGYELHRSLGIKEGDTVSFKGRNFKVGKTHPERGTKDDITMWMNLTECQELLDKKGRINAIQALECNCATLDRLGEIRAELMQILPDTQITETGSTALARAESRNNTKETAQKQIAAAKADRERLSQAREKFAGVLMPIVLLFAMVWIAMLALMNVRERVTEIGVLRAIGVGSKVILAAFLSRAVVAGLLGAVAGAAVFAAIYPMVKERFFHGIAMGQVVGGGEWFVPLLAAPLLAAVSAWLPSLMAAQKDPADVLRHD
jgi:ABC-type lipoprotein release transport system permease subunit